MLKLNKDEIIRLFSFIKHKALSYIIGLVGCSLIDTSVSTVVAFLIKDLYDAAVERQMNLIIRVCVILSVTIAVLCLLTPLVNYLFASVVKLDPNTEYDGLCASRCLLV